MKKFWVVLLLLIITSCSFYNNNSNKNIENSTISSVSSTEEFSNTNNDKNKKYLYDMDSNIFFKRDKDLFVNKMLFEYPSEISAKEGDPYTIEDLKNLDYVKDVSFCLQNFRIPSRCEIFSNGDKEYVIDFPKTDQYNLKIKFKNILDQSDLKGFKIKDILYKKVDDFKKEIGNNKDFSIKSEAIKIDDSSKNSYYFLAEDEKFSHTYLFVTSPSNIIMFEFIEEKTLSNESKYIMSDLLATMYIDSEDPLIVNKNFNNFSKKIDLFATNKLKFFNISIKLPTNMKLIQDDKDIKVYSNEEKSEIINQVIILESDLEKIKNESKNKHENIDIYYEFNKTSGIYLPPYYIVNMGEIENSNIKDKKSIRSEIRMYMDNYTFQGVKTCIDTEDKFITLLVTGPLSNSNEIRILNRNILNTIEFK